jgi:hypothetical protein
LLKDASIQPTLARHRGIATYEVSCRSWWMLRLGDAGQEKLPHIIKSRGEPGDRSLGGYFVCHASHASLVRIDPQGKSADTYAVPLPPRMEFHDTYPPRAKNSASPRTSAHGNHSDWRISLHRFLRSASSVRKKPQYGRATTACCRSTKRFGFSWADVP